MLKRIVNNSWFRAAVVSVAMVGLQMFVVSPWMKRQRMLNRIAASNLSDEEKAEERAKVYALKWWEL